MDPLVVINVYLTRDSSTEAVVTQGPTVEYTSSGSPLDDAIPPPPPSSASAMEASAAEEFPPPPSGLSEGSRTGLPPGYSSDEIPPPPEVPMGPESTTEDVPPPPD